MVWSKVLISSKCQAIFVPTFRRFGGPILTGGIGAISTFDLGCWIYIKRLAHMTHL